MIGLAFSFLDVNDRLGMRLNKRLNKIVEESKYYLQIMKLKEVVMFNLSNCLYL